MKRRTAVVTEGKPADLSLLLAACEQAGFAGGLTEYRFDKIRRWRFDLAWPALKVAFEKEGGVYTGGRHTRGKGYESDCAKYNAAAIQGWLLIRATVDMIESGLALGQLLQALRSRR